MKKLLQKSVTAEFFSDRVPIAEIETAVISVVNILVRLYYGFKGSLPKGKTEAYY